MAEKHVVEESDLFALREYLARKYSGEEGFDTYGQISNDTLLGRGTYGFTYVSQEKGFLDFRLRRKSGIFSFYDLLGFFYKEGELIEARLLEAKDNTDRKLMLDVAKTLKERLYGKIILGLDSITF